MNHIGYIDYDGNVLLDQFESPYCQSVLDASVLDKNDHYVLSDTNVIKLLT